MVRPSNHISVYLEIGHKRTFAGSLDWPGWCRSGRDENAALQALFNYSQRYATVLHKTSLHFKAPKDVSQLIVSERLTGDSTTDFGAPSIAPDSDARPVDKADLRRFEEILQSCWRAFDSATKAARGKSLRLGPRGGGRDLERIIQHVMGADEGYLSSLGWKIEKSKRSNPGQGLNRTRQVILDALASSARGEISARGPRGGIRWSARYFVRRVTWHVLDHAWEIEDRII